MLVPRRRARYESGRHPTVLLENRAEPHIEKKTKIRKKPPERRKNAPNPHTKNEIKTVQERTARRSVVFSLESD